MTPAALTLAVTNNPDSPLAAAAELAIDVAAGHERAVAATKTYTAELLALLLLVEGVRAGDGGLPADERAGAGRAARAGRARSPTRPRPSSARGTGSPASWSPPAGGTRTRPPGRRR